ncbi:AMP-binding protein, partial [Cobetia sp.]
MSEHAKVHPVTPDVAAHAWADRERYQAMYQQSVEAPETFWAEQAQSLDWFDAPSVIRNTNFGPGDVDVRWFEDGKLNVAHNCLDRHLAERGDQVAIIWEGDDPNESQSITYRELHARVSQFANGLKELGVKRGDVVTLYMPMIPEAAMAMLACTRIGAVHSVVFGGFSPDALAGRIVDSSSRIVITADESLRGGKRVPLKENVDEALERDGTDCVDHVLVVRRTGGEVNWGSRDAWFHELVDRQSSDCPAEAMGAEDPLFILYTSGSTGTPKGLKHTTGGYLLYAAMTHRYVFDYHDGDIYWCTADVGWVTGHSYIVYGPLANGA